MSGRFVQKGDLVVLDRETGLAWQRGASPDKMEWDYGFDYVKQLNESKFAGYDDWRYPTAEELKSLILDEETIETRLYLDPLFQATDGCWSQDEHGHHHGHHFVIFADFYYGDLYVFQHNYVNYFVRAVRNYEYDIKQADA